MDNGMDNASTHKGHESAAIRQKAIRGALWVQIETVTGKAVTFVSFFILARLLTPADYGIVTLISVLMILLGVWLNEGMADMIIQRQDLTDDHVNAAFWLNLGLSLVLITVAQAGAHLLARYYEIPVIEPMFRWLSLTMLFTALSAIASAMYRRHFNQRRFAFRTLISMVSGAIVGIGMALHGDGAWSLVGLNMTIPFVGCIVLWTGIKWRPSLRISGQCLLDVFHFSRRLMVANTFGFVADKIDVVIIGFFLPAAALGYYYVVQRLLMAVDMIALDPVHYLVLPVLARSQGDNRKVSKQYQKMVWIIASAYSPTLVGLGMLAYLLFPLIFGHKWDGAVPVMMAAALLSFTVPLNRPVQQVLVSVGHPGALTRLNIFRVFFNSAAFLVAVHFGIAAAAGALVFSSAVMVPFNQLLLHRYVEMHPFEVIRKVLPVFASVAVMTVALYGFQQTLVEHFFGVTGDVGATLINAGSQVAVGIIVYAGSLYGFAHRDVVEFVHDLYGIMPPKLKSIVAGRAA
jgi:O-antigen/teichoic acid export membrane protein